MKFAKVIAFLGAVAGLALASCSDSGDTAPPPVSPPPMEVSK